MNVKGWLEGNGDNGHSYTSNVRARTRAHARVMGLEPTVTTVVTVAKADEWPITQQCETVAQTVAKHRTVASAASHADLSGEFPWTIAGLMADVMRFHAKANVRHASRQHLRLLHEEIYRLRDLLIDVFAQQNGWRRSRAPFSPSMLARGAGYYGPREIECVWLGLFVDHAYYFRTPGRRAAAFATNPYGLHWTIDHPALRTFCERHRLHVSIPDFPTLWFPGQTTLIVFRPTD